MTDCLESLRINFRCDRPDLAKAEAGTNMWLEKHKEYLKWQEGSDSGILWLEGEAGCGKSTLIATILQKVEARRHFSLRRTCVSEDSEDDSQNKGPAFLKLRHCYDAANQGSNAASHLAMLRSILFQLLSQCGELFSWVRRTFQDLSKTTTGAREWNLEDLKDAFRSISSSHVSAKISGRVDYWIVLLVDAFDESEALNATRSAENPRSQALGILRSCCASRGRVRFKLIMSSRPLEDPEVRAMTKQFTMLKIQECNSPDVAMVIDAKMRELSNALRSSPLNYTEDQIGHYQETARQSSNSAIQLVRATKTEQPECGGFLGMVATYARQHHGGIILWVKLMSDEMIDFCLKTARTIKNVADKLADVPKNLKVFYKKMVEQLLYRLDYHDDNALLSDLQSARTLITWACFTGQVLTLGELRDIVACASFTGPLPSNNTFNTELRLNNRALWEAMRQSICHHCGNLVRISQTTSPRIKIFRSESGPLPSGMADESDEVTILHLSLGQYLRASKEENVRLLCLPEADAQAFMARSMKEYLVMTFRHDTLAAKDSSKWVETDFNNFTFHLNDRPFLPYVLKYLPDLFQHLTRAELPQGDNSIDLWGYLKHDFSNPDGRLAGELLSGWVSSSSSQRTYHYRSSNKFGRLCLIKAIENRHLVALKILLDLGINPNEPLSMKENDYPLILAIKKRSIAMVILMQLSGAGRIEPNKWVPITLGSPESAKPACRPLKAAIELQDLDLLDFLLQGDLDLGIRGQRVDDLDLWQAFDLQRDDILGKLHQSRVRSQQFTPWVELQISGHDGTSGTRLVPVMLDTGADCNMMSYSIIAKLGLKMTPISRELINLGGSKIHIRATTKCTCRIADTQEWFELEFLIMPKEESQGLRYIVLGIEFIKSRGMLSFESHSIKL
jgi:NACHT domain/Aspartyl protease